MKKRKPKAVQVVISSTFMVRSICKYCGKGPSYCYYMMNPAAHHDPRIRISISDSIMGWEMDHLKSQMKFPRKMKSLNKVSRFSFPLDYARYRPTLSRSTLKNGINNLIDVVNCECMKTSWQLTQAGAKNRPEIINRIGRYMYPQKLMD